MLLWVFVLCAALPGQPLSDPLLHGSTLIEKLRKGGFTLYFRHTATDWSDHDQVTAAGDWTSCDRSRMRQLSDAGRDAARAIGQALRHHRIPVGLVLASPYCRTLETARLMDIGTVEPSDRIVNLRVADYFGGRNAIIEATRTRLATPPPVGTNTVIVAHGNIAREATPVYPDEGEGVVFAADGSGGFIVVGRLPAGSWPALK